MSETIQYTHKDMASDQEVRWCPGCDDYVILRAVQRALPKIGKKREDIVFISGIGCSSRFPYYVETFGMHSIHGRAAPIATGVKLANPDLSVWMISGDGDSLAIGGNHFIHVLRRNIDLNIILFNNEIYGLTKGQFSPTSKLDQITKTSPYGNTQPPFNAGALAMGANARFFARVSGNSLKEMQTLFVQAEKFRGSALIEVMQNCPIFNEGAFDVYNDRAQRPNTQLFLEHAKPMIFGAEKNKGIVLKGLKLEVVTIGENGVVEEDILIHDAHEPDPTLHTMLVKLVNPIITGIIRSVDELTFGDRFIGQMNARKSAANGKTFNDLVVSGETYYLK